MTAPIVTEASRLAITDRKADHIMFDADNAPRFRHLRRTDGLLWARVAEGKANPDLAYPFYRRRHITSI